MRGLKGLRFTQGLLATTLVAFGTVGVLAPAANAQVVVGIGIQPVCSYGYYDYAPYECAPMGFYGQGYFHNGIFLGMGPWAGWGYGHGWGGYRFVGDGGGSYHGRGGYEAGRGHWANGRDDREAGYRGNNGRRGNDQRGEGHPNQGR